jgi:hypothetical protein
MPTEMELRARSRADLERANRPAPVDPKYFGLSGQPAQIEDRRNANVLELLYTLYGGPVSQFVEDIKTPFDMPERHRSSLLGPMPETTEDPMASAMGYGSIGKR